MADSSDIKSFISSHFNPHLKALLNILNLEAIRANATLTDYKDNNEFQKLVALSRWHTTDFYLFNYFQRFPHLISAEQQQQFRDKMTQKAVKSLRQLSELITICKSFNSRNLLYSVIKGPHLARMLYGNEAVKVSVDLDLLMVNPGDLADFHRALSDLGYTCFEQKILKGIWKQRLFISAKREVHFYNRTAGYAVDLHVRPFANTILTRNRYRNFFSDLKLVPFEGINIPVIPYEKYFVYLCHHGACHQFSRIGWLLDIRNYYLQKKETLDIEKLIAVAHSLNIGRSVYLVFYMLEILFKIPIPEKLTQTSDHHLTIKWLALNCLYAISYEKGESLRVKARVYRIVYLMKLSQGLAGKVDVMLSVFLRHLVLFIFGPKG
jgi:hypothetical protein